MGSQDEFYDLYPTLKVKMAPAIDKLRLRLRRGDGDIVVLENGNCTMEFQNIENNYVRFHFRSPLRPDEQFGYLGFLKIQFDGQGRQLLPLPPKDWDDNQQFNYFLEKFNELLVEGRFDAPLSGDFSWRQKYWDMEAEYKRLSDAWADLEWDNHPEAGPIFRKKDAGDLTWMDDMRRILGEQNSQS